MAGKYMRVNGNQYKKRHFYNQAFQEMYRQGC